MAIQIRRGTDAEWESNNSNIVAGEPAVTLDTGRFFVGTGSGEFVELQKKGDGDALTEDVKQALLQIASKVAYIDEHGQTYYNDLESALYPPSPLASISAVYTQGGTVYDTDSLDSLKSDLVVTAVYEDSSQAVVTTYTLSGTLTAGTSTITVSYGGKTTTFDVTVTHQAGTVTITNTLNGCTSSNSATFATEGDSYSTTITASSGYSLTGATVSVTMGNVDITSTAYNNGVISIASLTGNLSITITAVLIELVSISAVYTQSGTVYDTDLLDSLKDDLVVTATYSDSSTATIPSTDYTLSGTLTAGTSTITVAYGGKITTFDVTVISVVYDLPQGTYTFNDGSYVTVSNHNHVKVYLGSIQTNYVFNFSNISENTSNVWVSDNRDNKSLKFTLPSGTSCRYIVKNLSSNNGGKLSFGNRVANGTGTVQSGFGLTASGTTWQYDESGHLTGDYTATITASSDLKIGSLWVNLADTVGSDIFVGAELEFDVEIYSNNVRYV